MMKHQRPSSLTTLPTELQVHVGGFLVGGNDENIAPVLKALNWFRSIYTASVYNREAIQQNMCDLVKLNDVKTLTCLLGRVPSERYNKAIRYAAKQSTGNTTLQLFDCLSDLDMEACTTAGNLSNVRFLLTNCKLESIVNSITFNPHMDVVNVLSCAVKQHMNAFWGDTRKLASRILLAVHPEADIARVVMLIQLIAALNIKHNFKAQVLSSMWDLLARGHPVPWLDLTGAVSERTFEGSVTLVTLVSKNVPLIERLTMYRFVLDQSRDKAHFQRIAKAFQN
jgi:hypothetical protein